MKWIKVGNPPTAVNVEAIQWIDLGKRQFHMMNGELVGYGESEIPLIERLLERLGDHQSPRRAD